MYSVFVESPSNSSPYLRIKSLGVVYCVSSKFAIQRVGLRNGNGRTMNELLISLTCVLGTAP